MSADRLNVRFWQEDDFESGGVMQRLSVKAGFADELHVQRVTPRGLADTPEYVLRDKEMLFREAATHMQRSPDFPAELSRRLLSRNGYSVPASWQPMSRSEIERAIADGLRTPRFPV